MDHLGGLVELEQAQVAGTRDVEEDAAGALDGGLQQRAGDGVAGGVQGPTLAGGLAHAHQSGAGVCEHHLHIGEVSVDEARRGDQVRDSLNALEQDLIGHLERVLQGRLVGGDGEEAVVGDDDLGVDLLLEAHDAVLGLYGSATTLKPEGTGHHGDGQGAEGLGQLGDDRGRTGPGATALSGGHEDHVGALEHLLDLVAMVLRRLATDVRVAAGAEAPGQVTADVQLHVGIAHQ